MFGFSFANDDRLNAGAVYYQEVWVASTAHVFTGYAEKALFRFGDIPCFYPDCDAVRVERDDTTQKLKLRSAPLRGVQIRLIGKDPLTLLGCNECTQVTNSKEVDTNSARILYAKAAEILFGRDLLNTPGFRDITTRIQLVNQQRAVLTNNWTYQDRGGRLVTPFRGADAGNARHYTRCGL